MALHVDSPDRVEQLVEVALASDHNAAYLENTDGFEVELVAGQPSARAAD